MSRPAVWDIQGKRVIITGGNSGIGFETAKALSIQGAEITLLVRNRERGREAAARIAAASGRAPELVLADLAEKESLAAAADEILERYPRIDVLINNAGAYFGERRESSDGLEKTFALNHMGYFRLTLALLERLKASAPARIINVASAAHRRATLDLDDLQQQKRYRGFLVYSQSKLANIYFTRSLARRLEGSGITVNALHPGFVKSGFGSKNRGSLGPLLLRALARLVGISPEKGAETPVYLASSPEAEGISGAYFADCRQKAPSSRALDESAAERLWAISEELA